MGFDGEFFMRAAGVIEFTLAFSLMWTPLVRRASAIVLAAMFVVATFEFGKIDVIGHAPIVVVLLAIIGDDARRGSSGSAVSRLLVPVALLRRAGRIPDRLLLRARDAVRHADSLIARQSPPLAASVRPGSVDPRPCSFIFG